MQDVSEYLPHTVNSGPFLTAYTLNHLLQLVDDTKTVLPICSLGTPLDKLASLGSLVLPPLYHEALDEPLKSQILERIRECFPFYHTTRQRNAFRGRFEIVELPATPLPVIPSPIVLAFSVDTAVEEHGPHLPLATDTIQSYAVLDRLANEFDGFVVGPPVEYGHLTWGLPFGLSIDITPLLLTGYVTRFVNAVSEWTKPQSIYVVDVHGSPVHRQAIQDGVQASNCSRWTFRWLHEPLVEFAAERGDQHAGGVETALVHHINPDLLDATWWPDRIDEIAAGQLSFERALELTPDLPVFIDCVENSELNGVVGGIHNFYEVDAELMLSRMLEVARSDVRGLLENPA